MNPPPSPPPPDPAVPPPARPGGWLRWLAHRLRQAHAFYAAVRFLWSLALALLLIVLYLWIVGLPSVVVRELLSGLPSDPFPVSAARIRLDPPRGLIVEGVRVGNPHAPALDLCRVGRVRLQIDWIDCLRGHGALRNLTLSEGELLLPPTGVPASAEEPASLVLTGIGAFVQITNTEVRISGLTAALGGLHLRGEGRLLRAARPAEPPARFLGELYELLGRFETAPPWISRILREARAVRYDQSSEARVTFQVHPAHPDWTTLEWTAQGGRAAYEGLDVDRWNLRGALKGHDLKLDEAVLNAGTNRCHLSCSVDLTNRTFAGSVVNTIPPSQWPRVFPGRWQPWLRSHAKLQGGFKSEVWTPVVPLAEIGSRTAGWFSFEDATVERVRVSRGFVSFQREGPVLNVDRSRLTLQDGGATGTADVTFLWNTTGGVFQGTGQLAALPETVAPWLTSNQNVFARRFAFSNATPVFSADFAGRVGHPREFQLSGTLRATNASYRGVPAVWIETGVAFSNDTLTLRPFAFAREEGEVAGSLTVDFREQLYGVDLDGVIDPPAAAQMVGPGLQRALREARCERPALLHVHGVYDGNERGRTAIDVHMQGNRIGFGRFMADRASFLLHVGPDDYLTTNLTGSLNGGPFTGTVHVFKAPDGTNYAYEIAAAATNVDFAALLQAVATRPDQPTPPGKLSAWVDLRGLLGTGLGHTARGTGALRIAEGRLFEMPLLGGLSRYLSRIYPGLGFAAQNDFGASLNIASGRVSTADAMLEGSVLSVKGVGDYRFDRHLDFVVEVQPLREGVLATAVRVITMPVTKLLQFHLGGTVDEPNWRPENLPKELFLDFD